MFKPLEIYYPYKCFPDEITQNPRNAVVQEFSDLSVFYKNFRTILSYLKVPHEIINMMQPNYVISNPNPDKFYLLHQSHDKIYDNVWCLKTSYLRDYVYFDPTGYAQWAYITKKKELFNLSQTIPMNKVESFMEDYITKFIAGNISRLNQPSVSKPSFDYPYYLYAYQNWYDDRPIIAFADSLKTNYPDCKLLLKYHPKLGKNSHLIPEHPNIVVVNHSIHDLLPNCLGVLSTSSGVCVEALLYRKSIFTFGPHDFHYVANNLKLEDIDSIVSLSKQPFQEEKVFKFLYFLMNYYWVNVNDLFAIQNRFMMMTKGDKNFRLYKY